MTKILLIDDDPNVLDALSITLEEDGYSVAIAQDANLGLRLVEEHAFDLVITDIIMPGKEGLETILELKRNQPELNVVAMSGGGRLSSTPYLNMASALGVKSTLAKPFSASELLATVEKAIN